VRETVGWGGVAGRPDTLCEQKSGGFSRRAEFLTLTLSLKIYLIPPRYVRACGVCACSRRSRPATARAEPPTTSTTTTAPTATAAAAAAGLATTNPAAAATTATAATTSAPATAVTATPLPAATTTTAARHKAATLTSAARPGFGFGLEGPAQTAHGRRARGGRFLVPHLLGLAPVVLGVQRIVRARALAEGFASSTSSGRGGRQGGRATTALILTPPASGCEAVGPLQEEGPGSRARPAFDGRNDGRRGRDVGHAHGLGLGRRRRGRDVGHAHGLGLKRRRRGRDVGHAHGLGLAFRRGGHDPPPAPHGKRPAAEAAAHLLDNLQKPVGPPAQGGWGDGQGRRWATRREATGD